MKYQRKCTLDLANFVKMLGLENRLKFSLPILLVIFYGVDILYHAEKENGWRVEWGGGGFVGDKKQ